MKELTFGTFGFILWKNCFSVKLEDEKLIMGVPFKKVILPIKNIEKIQLTSCAKATLGISYAMSGTYLKIIHNDLKAPKNIYFLTTQSNVWIEIFKNNNIPVDTTQSANKSEKLLKPVSSIVGIIGVICAIAAFVVAIIAFFKTRG